VCERRAREQQSVVPACCVGAAGSPTMGRMLTFLCRGLAIVVLVSTSACGESDEEDAFGPGCDEADCHGDVTGAWAVSGGCAIDAVETSDECPGLICTVRQVGVGGSWDFRADKTASFEWHATLETDCEVPKSCIMVACADLAVGSRSCTDAGDHCACSQSDDDEGSRSGTWTVDSTMLQVSDSAGMTGTSNWCVREDLLAINVLASRPLQFDAVGFVGLAKVRLTADRR
jgi:hypothetical protein